jgi:hypothetical protein
MYLASVKEVLEDGANAGDVQTCVFRNDQTVLIVDLEIELIREWYLSYVDL